MFMNKKQREAKAVQTQMQKGFEIDAFNAENTIRTASYAPTFQNEQSRVIDKGALIKAATNARVENTSAFRAKADDTSINYSLQAVPQSNQLTNEPTTYRLWMIIAHESTSKGNEHKTLIASEETGLTKQELDEIFSCFQMQMIEDGWQQVAPQIAATNKTPTMAAAKTPAP